MLLLAAEPPAREAEPVERHSQSETGNETNYLLWGGQHERPPHKIG
ncbi:hypothetical protein NSTCB13_01433 [Nostoc sp. DSM 114160]|jgi:hypothetical protein